MLFNATFTNISVNRAGQVYWGMKPEDLEKITDLSHVEYRINMTWLGFTDIHSGIQSYFVSIGSEYMANDLNKVNID
jgi:hypothetical protein